MCLAESKTPSVRGRVAGVESPSSAVWGGSRCGNSTADQPSLVKLGFPSPAVTRRYRTLTERRTSALLVRKSSPLCTDKPEGPGSGLLTLPGETGMPMVNGAYRARVLAPLISERGAKGQKAGQFTGGLVL